MSDTVEHSMDAAEDLTAYKGATVAKLFPGYGDKPFTGKVVKVDTKGSDDKPFKIVYEDGDLEWVTVDELKSIVVDKATSKKKRGRPSTQPDQPDATPAAAAADQHTSSKKQKSSSKSDKAAAAAAEEKQQQAPSAAAAAAGADKDKAFNAEAEKRKLKEQQQKDLGGMTSFTLTAGAVQKAADKGRKAAGSSAEAGATRDANAPAAAAAASGSSKGQKQQQKPSSKQAAAAGAAGAGSGGFAGAASSPSVDTQGLLTAIHQNAEPTGNKLAQDRQVVRLPYSGPGAAMLPAMSQAIICNGHIEISLISARPRSSMTPGRTLTSGQASASAAAAAGGGGVYKPGQHDYSAEASVLLAELDRLLQQAGTNKTHLTYVRVTLRSMRDGLFGFTEAWNGWVDRKFAPRMTLLEAAGPIPSCGITLEAKARINAA